MKNGLLIRVAIDSTSGGWNSPCGDRSFCYVPMGITKLTEDYDARYGPYQSAVAALVLDSAPARTRWPRRLPQLGHFDPDFDELTYGDSGQRAKRMREVLSEGNDSFIVFYAALCSIHTGELIYSIIGFYTIDRIVAAPDVPPSDWHRNEHTRPDGCSDEGHVVVFARPGESGRLLEHIPIGSYRQRAYRVTRTLLDEWGGLGVKNGYIQRSAFLPRFCDPERFLDWFHKQKPAMIPRNKPTTATPNKSLDRSADNLFLNLLV